MKKMSREKTLSVSPILLEKAIIDRGFSLTYVSRGIGKSDTYISSVKYSGNISKSAALLLDKIYGIAYKEYASTQG